MLDDRLIAHAESNIYPFHMPGHKRQMRERWDAYGMDITEIEGFDDLHDPKGILQEAQKRAADLYGAKQSYYLVNGSTCGLLAAICGIAPKGSRILMARDCHKAAYHGAFLAELKITYLYPVQTSRGLNGQISPESLKRELEKGEEYAALMLTSPTYDGICSDVGALAEIAHAHGIPVIVDEAHGAHFGLSEHFPQSAVTLGADVVIQSLHKTLPSLTQTALLHLCSDRVSGEEVKRYLDIFETSSPSYVLMAGMERCIRLMAEQGQELFSAYREKLDAFYARTRNLKNLKVLTRRDYSRTEAFDVDASKIVICTAGAGRADAGQADTRLTGAKLRRRLLEEYELQMEMAAADYVLAMTSVMDTKEGFSRLAEALLAIDKELSEAAGAPAESGRSARAWEIQDKRETMGEIKTARGLESDAPRFDASDYPLTLAEAIRKPREEVGLEEAKGRVSAAYVCLYPPGIPLLVPGERITAGFLAQVEDSRQAGLEIQGLSANHRIKVVNFGGLYYTE